MPDPLDNPAWPALTGPHERFAVGTGRALRYAADVAAFYAAPDSLDPDVWDGLRTLASGEPVVFMRAGPVEAPDGWRQLYDERLTQYVAEDLPPADSLPAGTDVDVVELRAEDVDDMVALTKLTEPGPFMARTIELGHYIGIRERGRLVAMAGERLQGDSFSEISAVCVHPEARRRGLAALLTIMVAEEIRDRGQVAMLHVRPANHGGHALYRSIGFRERAKIQVSVWGRADRNESIDD